jgi:hypothetical protein
MDEDTAAHQEHCSRADDRQAPRINGAPRECSSRCGAESGDHRVTAASAEMESDIVELDDATDQTIDARRHDERDADQHPDPSGERRVRHVAQRDHNALRGEHEVGTHGPLDLRFLGRYEVHREIGPGMHQVGMVHSVLGPAPHELVRELLEPFVAEVCAAQHEQWHHGPRHESADGQRRRHQDGLVP